MINNLLITGCSYGLGRALALRLAKDNLHIYAVGRSTHLLTELTKISSNIQPIVADIMSENDREKIYESINIDEPLSIIHNAAIAKPCQFNSLSENLLRQHIETNYIAPLIITNRLLSLLTKGQRILHITSGAAAMSIPGLMAYSTTKAAMQLAITSLNEELSFPGVFCANLRPGMLDTPMYEELRNTDSHILPGRNFYCNVKKENKLISPEIASEFIAWAILKTDSDIFSKTAWNIYDEFHHKYWLPLNVKIMAP